ncbi:MAG: hypothetical protein NC308_02415 [Clostridium sp.]|nr:hypothetical protein [Bacteroides sp.]MCM1197717.1 hypothetical protein [Clostridium sp.]
MVLVQEKHYIDATIRAALKSASGGEYAHARYYDNAGYFFDASFGHSFKLGHSPVELRLAASGGFLCWQTDNGRQNDAIMYGLKTELTARRLKASAEYGGYVGWEKDGDAPMTIKVRFGYELKIVELSIGYQAGLMDWPFHQISVGVICRL